MRIPALSYHTTAAHPYYICTHNIRVPTNFAFKYLKVCLQTGTKVAADPATLTGSILVVLVTFRTNNAYLRFDEARKMWGLLLNRSRDIVRQCVSFFPEDDMHRKATFARWTIALSQSLKCHLRPGYTEDLQKDLENVLCEQEMNLLMTADHRVCSSLCCVFSLFWANFC